MTSVMLSPKMASKRPSAADTFFPPKKRALYEHMKLHGIDKYSTNEIAANGIIQYQENLGMCGMKLPMNIEIAQSENFSRTRSDSLHSHVSSNSDNTETGSSGSRETSPCTIQSMFDHQTPERNPIISLEGLKSDISKPLFPPSDSDSSLVDSEGHISPDNTINDQQDKVMLGNHRSLQIASNQEMVDNKGIPEKHNDTNTFQDEKCGKNDLLGSLMIQNNLWQGVAEDEEKHTSVKQRQPEVYMGPMVSLLNRFNAEAPQGNVGLKIKEQFSLEQVGNTVQFKSSVNQSPVINHAQSLPYLPSSVQSQILTEKIDKVQSESKSCHICNKEFTSRSNLNNHMKSHESKLIPCWVCKEMFNSGENLNAHMKLEHKGENPYKCEHCSREFTQFNNLRRHIRVHREKVFKCNLCNREFNEEFYLKMHMGTHTGKRVYSCGVCGAGFPSSHDLKMHVKTHSPSLLHTCDVCGKSFSKACVLRQHKKGHSGERPHKCDKCEKTFIHRHHLTMHMKSHVDEKRLSCNICKKEFSQHSHLYKHLRAHEDMKKYGVELDSVQTTSHDELNSAQNKEISRGNKIEQKPTSQVVYEDNIAINKEEISEKHSRKRESIGSRETQKQRRRYVSNDPQRQSPGIVSVPLSAPSSNNNNYPLPSMAQTFAHNMIRHPSMQYNQDISRNYMPGSPAPPFSPLFNPLLGNRVPAPPLPGYQSYNQLYRNYSEQMQTYYNNMYMMQYMAQNALLQKGPVEGHSFQNQNYFRQKQNESETEQKSSEYKRWSMEPKVIEGVQRLRTEEKCGDKDSDSKDVVRQEAVQSDSDENSELDVVTETNELDQGKPDLYAENYKISEECENIQVTVEQGNIISEEHEIAQELLKMSAGTEGIRTFVEVKGLNTAKEEKESERIVMAAKDEDHNKGDVSVNFSHCINDIIEKNIRNSNMISENANTAKFPTMKAYDTTSFDNVARLQGELSVAIPESVNQSFEASDQDRNNVEQTSDQEKAIESDIRDTNENNESQTSPLQKLEMFVTSEYNDFNKVETALDVPKEIVPNIKGYFTENIIKLASVQNENVAIGKLEGDCSKTGENFVELLNGKNEVKKGVASEGASVKDGLETRLEKIRQFADIGIHFGNIINEKVESKLVDTEIDEMNDLEAEVVEDNNNDRTGIENMDNEFREGKVVNGNCGDIKESGNIMEGENVCDVKVGDKGKPTDDVPGYFDDSLEDRQLEIVETDSFRGEGTEKFINNDGENEGMDREYPGKLNGNEVTEEEDKDKEVANNSNEGYIFTENEFLTHISQINDRSEVNENKSVEVVNDISQGKAEDSGVVGEDNVEGFVQMSGSEKTDAEMNLMNGKNHTHQAREVGNDTNGENNTIQAREVGNDRTVLELRKEQFVENETENGAIDLRTKKKVKTGNGDKACVAVKILQNISSQENLPMDLSLSRRWKDESGSETSRECKNDRMHNDNKENISPSLELSCGLCRMKFKSISELQLHQIEHAKDIGYHCNICKKSFNGAFELQCHMLKHRNSETPAKNQFNSNVKCIEKSVSRFNEQNDYSNNYKIIGEANLDIRQSELSQRNETEEKQYRCEYCDKTFVLEEQLREHVTVHNASKKPYVCNICRRAFVHRHNLNRHKMSHNSKSFKCDICHRSFKEAFYLQMHVKTHDEENYHKCQICGENVCKADIWRHTNQHILKMTENPTYEQIGNRVKEILREQDVNIDGATQRNINEYGENLRNTKLDELSTNDRALNLKRENVDNLNANNSARTEVKHINVFQNIENPTGALVLHENSYAENLKNTGQSPYKKFECHICKYVLSTKHELENHMGIHTGLRPFVCQTCGRAFKKSKGLKTHAKIHLESSFN